MIVASVGLAFTYAASGETHSRAYSDLQSEVVCSILVTGTEALDRFQHKGVEDGDCTNRTALS